MKLVLLYGPPASGKLTIAQLLAEQTGMLLVHNHMVVDFVASLGGESCLVQITCDKSVILARVEDESRKKWQKIHSRERLAELLDQLEDPFQLVNGRSSLIIDSGTMSPETAVAKIIEQYELQEAS